MLTNTDIHLLVEALSLIKHKAHGLKFISYSLNVSVMYSMCLSALNLVAS